MFNLTIKNINYTVKHIQGKYEDYIFNAYMFSSLLQSEDLEAISERLYDYGILLEEDYRSIIIDKLESKGKHFKNIIAFDDINSTWNVIINEAFRSIEETIKSDVIAYVPLGDEKTDPFVKYAKKYFEPLAQTGVWIKVS